MYLLVQHQLSMRPVKQSGGQEWDVVYDITCTKDHNINVLLHGAIFKQNPGVLEAFQIGLQYYRSLNDSTRKIITDHSRSIQRSKKRKKACQINTANIISD